MAKPNRSTSEFRSTSELFRRLPAHKNVAVDLMGCGPNLRGLGLRWQGDSRDTAFQRDQPGLGDETPPAHESGVALRFPPPSKMLMPAYAAVAAKLGQTENTIAAAVHRMRDEFRTLLRQEVTDTLATGEAVDEELRYLLRLAW